MEEWWWKLERLQRGSYWHFGVEILDLKKKKGIRGYWDWEAFICLDFKLCIWCLAVWVLYSLLFNFSSNFISTFFFFFLFICQLLTIKFYFYEWVIYIFGDHKMDRLIYIGPRGTTQMELHNSLKKTQIATCAVEILAGHQKPKHPTANWTEPVRKTAMASLATLASVQPTTIKGLGGSTLIGTKLFVKPTRQSFKPKNNR